MKKIVAVVFDGENKCICVTDDPDIEKMTKGTGYRVVTGVPFIHDLLATLPKVVIDRKELKSIREKYSSLLDELIEDHPRLDDLTCKILAESPLSILTWEDLLKCTEQQIFSIKNIGRRRLTDIKDALAEKFESKLTVGQATRQKN